MVQTLLKAYVFQESANWLLESVGVLGQTIGQIGVFGPARHLLVRIWGQRASGQVSDFRMFRKSCRVRVAGLSPTIHELAIAILQMLLAPPRNILSAAPVIAMGPRESALPPNGCDCIRKYLWVSCRCVCRRGLWFRLQATLRGWKCRTFREVLLS